MKFPSPIDTGEIVSTEDLTRIESLGKEIYEKNVRPLMGPSLHGQTVVIDVTSGQYAVNPDDATALFELMDKCPGAFTWTERVGHGGALHIGFGGAELVSDD